MYHSLPVQKVLELVDSSPNGLTQIEVEKRQKKYGPNVLPEKKKTTTLSLFLSQFKSPLVYILLIGAVISFALKEFIDGGIILAAVLINAIMGFLQENKAEKTLLRLKQIVEHKTIVRREGIEQVVLSNKLVPGDIIILGAGDIIPADGRIINSKNFEVNESVLTGESTPSPKTNKILKEETPLADRENMVYNGTIVDRGKAEVVVVNIGEYSEIGKIALLIKKTPEEKTPLQKKISSLSKTLSIIIGASCFVLFVSGIIIGRPFLEMLLTSIAVAVAGIPEGLLIAVTICLVIGMQTLSKNNSLVKKLVATETLGSVTTIISDKTETLTEGKMVVTHILPKEGKSVDDILRVGLLCNEAVIENPKEKQEKWIIFGDSTDEALIREAIRAGLKREEIIKEYPKLDEISFESKKKQMSVLCQNKTSNIILVKGAPEIIFKYCLLKKDEQEKNLSLVKNLTKSGLRILAFAQKETKEKKIPSEFSDFEYLGLVALKDPLRKEAKEVIKECYKMGVRPILATGDHKLTALFIGKEVGIRECGVIEGKDIDQMSDEELKKIIKKNGIFARVTPKHKMRLIKILRNDQEVIAMTGDGVNDAPAIKSADIGIALGSGSEVTKEIADIILLDNNLKTILTAIKEGRNIFDNIKKIILYLLSDGFTELILIGGSLLFGWPLPVAAAQILWVNIIEDTLPALSLSYEKPITDISQTKPRDLKSPLLDREMKFLIVIIGIATDLILLGLFGWLLKDAHLPINHIRTFIFANLAIDSLLNIYSCKNLNKNLWHYNPFNNRFLNLTVLFGFGMLLIGVYIPFFQNILKTVPLNFFDWLLLVVLGFLEITLVELGKMIFIRKNSKLTATNAKN